MKRPHDQEDGPTPKAVEEPMVLTATQVARLLQIGERTLWRHVNSGEMIAPVRFGGSTRWPRAAVENWIAAGCPRPGTDKNGRRR